MQRVIETVKFIAATNGNFMGMLELLAKFDPFLSQHLAKFGSCGRGVASLVKDYVRTGDTSDGEES